MELTMKEIIRHAFTLKYYCNLFIAPNYFENFKQMDMMITIDELNNYIKNIKDNYDVSIIDDLPEFHILEDKIYDEEVKIYGTCERNYQSIAFYLVSRKMKDEKLNEEYKTVFFYNDTVKDFKPMDLSQLNDIEKNAFYSKEAIKSLKMIYTKDVTEENTKQIVKERKLKFCK